MSESLSFATQVTAEVVCPSIFRICLPLTKFRSRKTYKAYVKESRGKDKWLVEYPNWEDPNDNTEVLTTDEVKLYKVKKKRRN